MPKEKKFPKEIYVRREDDGGRGDRDSWLRADDELEEIVNDGCYPVVVAVYQLVGTKVYKQQVVEVQRK